MNVWTVLRVRDSLSTGVLPELEVSLLQNPPGSGYQSGGGHRHTEEGPLAAAEVVDGLSLLDAHAQHAGGEVPRCALLLQESV